MACGHREVLIRGYVDEVMISCGAEVIARHRRCTWRSLIRNPTAAAHGLGKLLKYSGTVQRSVGHGFDLVRPGIEKIAASWADARGVNQVICRPDWNAHGKAAPFRRNDELLNFLPKGMIAFPGSGITGNLIDKARQLGIPVYNVGA